MEDKGFQVFDFEALNWNKLYAVGIFDGKYKFIAEENRKNSFFVSWLLDNLEPDVVAYAHNGGRYDFLFIFEFCERERIKPYGLKLIHGSIAEFRIKYKGNRYIFRDSFLILPSSLKSLTYDFDVEHKKLELDYKIGIKDKRFADYFKNDVLGLYEVLKASDLTKHLTIASNSFSIFKNVYYHNKMEQNNINIENLFRQGYKGGRVEIFKMYGEKLNYYDINSLYPSVMRDFQYPSPIKDNFKKIYKLNTDKLGYFRIIVEIDNLNVPVLHYNNNGKMIYPIGKIEGFFYSPEIFKAIEMGYRIKVLYGYEFIKTEYIFRDFVEHFYKIKSESVGAKQSIAKLLLNSLYGKFGQRREKEANSFINDGTVSNLNYISKKYFDTHSEFIHPEIAGLVTANARVRLYDLFQKAGLDKIYYCDTDSIITDTVLPTSTKLGDIKKEADIDEFIALSPKLYAFRGDKYIKNNGFKRGIFIKSKGFKSENFTFDDFKRALFKGDTSKFIENRERLSTFKERFKRLKIQNFGDIISISKHLRGLYDKRVILSDYSTVPIPLNITKN